MKDDEQINDEDRDVENLEIDSLLPLNRRRNTSFEYQNESTTKSGVALLKSTQTASVVSKHLCWLSNIVSNCFVSAIVIFLTWYCLRYNNNQFDLHRQHQEIAFSLLNNEVNATSVINDFGLSKEPKNNSSYPVSPWNAGTTKNVKDDTCQRIFEWSMIDHCEVETVITNESSPLLQGLLNDDVKQYHKTKHKAIKLQTKQTTHVLSMARSGAPSAKGKIDMKVTLLEEDGVKKEIKTKETKTNETKVATPPVSNAKVVADIRSLENAFSTNVWHRMTAQYATWVAFQTAQWLFGIPYLPDRVILLTSTCDETLPQGWSKLAETVICNSNDSRLQDANVLIEPPKDGLLWDLSWDDKLQCHDSNMFQTFAQIYQPRMNIGNNEDQILGCFISRQGSKQRKVKNLEEFIDMMHGIFNRVRQLRITQEHNTDDIVDLLYECRVLVGVHGAGHMNAMLSQPGSPIAVVEILGESAVSSIPDVPPQYYRNINMLMGNYYEGIVGDEHHGINDKYFILNITEVQDALIRAKQYIVTSSGDI